VSTASSEQPADATRGRLIESHLPLVHSVARRYVGRGEALDDLVQVGSVGLIKASNRYDESRGVTFAAFAAPAIDGEIRRHLRDRSSTLRIPRDLQQTSGELRRQRGELAAALGRSPTIGELASALDADEHHVERALKAEQAREAIPLSPGGDSVDLPDGSDQQRGSEDRLLLTPSVRALDEPERTIVFLRFHADMTERQIAHELGISQAHVSRLLSSALQRLRAELAESDQGKGSRDTSTDTVISPPSGGTSGAERGRKARRGRTNLRRRKGKIGRVGGSHENRTLAHYLGLPYHVAVKSEGNGAGGWSASVEELPGCTARGGTPDEAVDMLRPAMQAWLESALAAHREIPMPSAAETSKQRSASSFSGRFLVRMSGSLHEQLADAAEHQQVSLNRFVTNTLAASVSPAPSVSPPPPVSPVSSPKAKPATEDRGQDLQSNEPTKRSGSRPPRAFRVALATNLAVVVFAGAVAIVLLVLALERGI
jgi:RNA polymerase sigma-B factor